MRSALRHQPPEPFSSSKLRIAAGEKNAYDIMQKAQKRIQTKRPCSPSKIITVSEQPLAKKQKGDEPETQQQLTPAAGAKKASGTAFQSGVWQWFSELQIEGVRHGICIGWQTMWCQDSLWRFNNIVMVAPQDSTWLYWQCEAGKTKYVFDLIDQFDQSIRITYLPFNRQMGRSN